MARTIVERVPTTRHRIRLFTQPATGWRNPRRLAPHRSGSRRLRGPGHLPIQAWGCSKGASVSPRRLRTSAPGPGHLSIRHIDRPDCLHDNYSASDAIRHGGSASYADEPDLHRLARMLHGLEGGIGTDSGRISVQLIVGIGPDL